MIDDKQTDEYGQETFRQFVRACHASTAKKDFRLSVYPKLMKLLPHDMFACGVGRIADFRVQGMVNLSFPENYIKRVIKDDKRITSPVVRQWVLERSPVMIEREKAVIDDLDADWVDGLDAFGLKNIVGHGVADIGHEFACFFSFAGISNWTPRDRYMLELLVPHLHYALTKMYDIRNVSPKMDVERETTGLLSPREQEVLKWICTGKTNTEIATILGISPWTVKIHVRNLFQKLRVSNRGHAVACALRLGFVAI